MISNLTLLAAAGVVALAAVAAPAKAAPAGIKNIVLVHGAWVDGSGWQGVYQVLKKDGYNVSIVQNPLSSLADDVAATKRVLALQDGAVILVGHSYGGAVITEAGDHPNVTGLVYIAAFAPDAGESPGGITAKHPPVAVPNLAPDSDGYLWIKPDKFHESFCQDLTVDEGLVMAVTQKAPLASTFENMLQIWERG